MANEELERERRAFWSDCCRTAIGTSERIDVDIEWAAKQADSLLAERDKRFSVDAYQKLRDRKTCNTCAHYDPVFGSDACDKL